MARGSSFNFGANAKPRKARSGGKGRSRSGGGKKRGGSSGGNRSSAWRAYVSSAPLPD
jgi:hypothetical protein